MRQRFLVPVVVVVVSVALYVVSFPKTTQVVVQQILGCIPNRNDNTI